MFQTYLALGSNLGDRLEHLTAGLVELNSRGVRVLRTASVYSTEPRGILAQPWFLNTAIEAYTELEPQRLMRVCLEVEKHRHRRRYRANGPRTLDIDIIFFGDRVVQSPDLMIPHPRYALRRFVLEPLAEIASDHLDPLRDQTVAQLLETVDDSSVVQLFAPPLDTGTDYSKPPKASGLELAESGPCLRRRSKEAGDRARRK